MKNVAALLYNLSRFTAKKLHCLSLQSYSNYSWNSWLYTFLQCSQLTVDTLDLIPLQFSSTYSWYTWSYTFTTSMYRKGLREVCSSANRWSIRKLQAQLTITTQFETDTNMLKHPIRNYTTLAHIFHLKRSERAKNNGIKHAKTKCFNISPPGSKEIMALFWFLLAQFVH